jgi:hypothetical protein
VLPATAERWLGRLLAKSSGHDSVDAIVQIGALTGDQARDISEGMRTRILETLRAAGVDEERLRPLTEIVAPKRADQSRVFGEALPEGLKLEA